MGLFDIFSKKKSGPEIRDLVWMNHSAKLKGSLQLFDQHPDVIFIAWFNDTEQEYQQFFKEKKGNGPEIKMAKGLSPFMVNGKTVIFLEHYPIKSKEENLIADWNAQNIFVLSALDEPLFELFGGERIIGLMKQMGVKEEEAIEHAMISISIAKAQRKLEDKIGVEALAHSSVEWFKKNKR